MLMRETRPKVSDFIVGRLAAWGVERVFGYAGDGINGLLAAFDRAQAEDGQLAFVPSPHEELASLMACAYAKFTGRVGVCMATQGPGAIHLLNGLYDAKLDHQPVVAIIGQVTRDARGSGYQQEVDLQTLFKDVAGTYIIEVTSPAQARHAVDRAMRVAYAARTVACVIVPQDVQELEATPAPPHAHGEMHSSLGHVAVRAIPSDAELQRAADALAAGQRVAMLIGQGALGAGEAVIEIAERLGAGVAKALLGKSALPDDLPFVTGSIGWLGTRASNEMMAECDTLLVVGSGFPYTEYLPQEGSARAVQIDVDPAAIGIRFPVDVGLVGDAATTLRALSTRLAPKHDRAWRARLEAKVTAWREERESRALAEASPLNPELVVRELSRRLPDGAVICGDSGSSTVWYARQLDLRSGMLASLSGTLATMGSALPYAYAAKVAYPDRPVVAIAGDGAMQMSGLNMLVAIADAYREWDDPRLIVLVLNNQDLNFVTWEQRAMLGVRKFERSQRVPDFPYARYGEMLGLESVRMASPVDVVAGWERALAARRPVVVEAVTDPSVPPLPPELTKAQSKNLDEALAHGDADAEAVARQLKRAKY
jgi:pyruvate dehydrogenase (quinone)